MTQPVGIASLQTLAWVNEYTQTAMPIHGEAVEPILHFSLMWNLFGRYACGKDATRTRIQASVNSAAAAGQIALASFAEHLAYFQNRSQRDGMTIESYLDALKMKNQIDRQLVGQVLQGHEHNAKNVVQALLLVALRIRNNLFHGEKEVAYLHAQAELFRAVNSLIATYLTVTKSAA